MTKETFNPKKVVSLMIHRDQDPPDPREWGNLGIMACWHKRYILGDVQPSVEPRKWLEMNSPEGSVELPIFMMDHSGLTLSTSDHLFKAADPVSLDWGQLGVIIATPSRIKEVFKVKRITESTRKKARKALEQEVATYNDFVNDQCWGYVATDNNGNVEAVSGFIGGPLEETNLKESIPSGARPLLEEAWENRK